VSVAVRVGFGRGAQRFDGEIIARDLRLYGEAVVALAFGARVWRCGNSIGFTHGNTPSRRDSAASC
jgi:hypothetical protein